MAAKGLLVPVKDLSEVMRRLATYLDSQEVESISITKDYYWVIPSDERYTPNVDPDPQKLTLGQLTHDWERLQSMLDEDRMTTRFALNWLAAVLVVIADDSETPFI